MIRIGTGYDVHRLGENRKLILGGVNIDYNLGLVGHSDADVLVHAIMDSLLGAAAMGDIGKMFPDSDMTYKDADSIKLLQKVGERLSNAGYKVSNIDSTIVAQKPKLAPYIESMAGNISKALNIDFSCVSVKATTTEKLGFEGEGLGISAQAVCIIETKGE